MSEANTLAVHKKKHDLNAKNAYQYNKLKTARFYFVPCEVTETYDEVVFVYDLEGLAAFGEARNMSNKDKYGMLLQILEAVLRSPEYTFLINPDNLYFDIHKRIRILERDIRSRTDDSRPERLLEMRALAGYLLQRKYTYENLREGGSALLNKKGNTKFLLELESLEQMSECFRNLHGEETEREKRLFVQVGKKEYRRKVWFMGLTAAGCVGLGVLAAYQNKFMISPQQRALTAERAYMEQDFTGVVDALAHIPLEQIDKHEKYLLAVVSVRGQSVDNFDLNTKERLLSKLSYDGDEYLLDYWIALGRVDVDQALDIAMRMSDHQLTLYAYLQKIDLISADTSLSGDEKVQQIDSLRGKIKALAEELGIEYQEK